VGNKIEIPLSKLKIGLLFIGAILFVILGIQFIVSPEEWISSKLKSPELLRILGIITVSFFGICGLFIGKKLFDTQIGLTINDEGITDNTNATSIGLIEWDDIIGIERIDIASTKILVIITDKPDKYISRAKNGLSKRAMKANHKMYGSPLSIISNSLKMKFSELDELVVSEFEKKKNYRI